MSRKKKLFQCTSCPRKCSHVTTRWDKRDGHIVVGKGEKLCPWCLNKRLNEKDQSIEEQFRSLSIEDQQMLLAELEQEQT